RGALLKAAHIEVRVTRHDVLDDVVHELPRDRRRTEALVAPRLVGREARRGYEPGAPQVHAVAAVEVADRLPRIDEPPVLGAQPWEGAGSRAFLFGGTPGGGRGGPGTREQRFRRGSAPGG